MQYACFKSEEQDVQCFIPINMLLFRYEMFFILHAIGECKADVELMFKFM